MKNKKIYSREERISYYELRLAKSLVAQLEAASEERFCKARLAYLTGEEFQDWNGELQKQLDSKKGEGA